MTSKQLERLCRKWRKRLGLLDWHIGVSFVPGTELDEGTWANVSWTPDEMRADVWLIRPEEIPADAEANFTERHLVHELLHILIGGHAEFAGHNVNEERAINRIRDAFVPNKDKG